jgi:hypothetical protein
MIKLFPFEDFREISLNSSMRLRYAISNRGRLVSFKNDILEGNIVKGSTINEYRIFRYKIYEDGKIINRHKLIGRMVAETFLVKPTEEHNFVLRHDFDKTNDNVTNLRWATNQEMYEHSQKSDKMVQARTKVAGKQPHSPNAKLTAGKVKVIKRLLAKPGKTRQNIIAKQFGVSATQIKRIARNENWADV